MSIFDLSVYSVKTDNNQLIKKSLSSHPIYMLDDSKSNLNVGAAPTITNGGATLYISRIFTIAQGAQGANNQHIRACRTPVDGSQPLFDYVTFAADGGIISTYVDANIIYVNYSNSGNFRAEYNMTTYTWTSGIANHYTSGSVISTSVTYGGLVYSGDGLVAGSYLIPLVKVT